MKLRVVELLLISTIPAMALAERGLPPLGITVATLLGGTLAAGSANAFNQVIEKDLDDDLAVHAVSEYSAPTVDYASAIHFSNKRAHSMCDVSDALIIQAEQIAAASGVALKFDQELIAQHPEFVTLKELADSQNVDVWQWIFAGGEDHVFLATGNDLGGFRVGEVIAGSGVLGAEMKKAPDTWRHFN